MRPLFTIVLLLVVLTTSCTRSGVPIQSGGDLSAAERQSIVTLHPDFADWIPSHSALWVRQGVTQHVFIRNGDFSNLGGTSSGVLVFNGAGGLVEANIIESPAPPKPITVSSVSPVRVTYEGPNGLSMECTGRYSLATWRHDILKYMDMQQKMQKIAKSWFRSGSTNLAELNQMMQSAIKDSQK